MKNLKYILSTVFILTMNLAFPICISSQASSIKLELNKDRDSVYVMLTDTSNLKYTDGKGKWVNWLDEIGRFSAGIYDSIANMGFGLEAADKHWFNANLASNGDHIHDANGNSSTVIDLDDFILLFSGLPSRFWVSPDEASMEFPIINIIAEDDLFINAGTDNNPTINVMSTGDMIQLIENEGDVRIPNLEDNEDPDFFVGYSGVTGRLYKSPPPSGGPGAAVGYKEWSGIVNFQGGLNNPTETEFNNTFEGVLDWVHHVSNNGEYQVTYGGSDLDWDKTLVQIDFYGGTDEISHKWLSQSEPLFFRVDVMDEALNPLNLASGVTAHVVIRQYP